MGQLLIGQDKLFYPSGQVVEGEVLEMRKNDFSFLKSTLPDGPIYYIEYLDIDSILFEEGIVEVMASVGSQRSSSFNFYKNTFSIDLVEPVFKAIEFRYERNLNERVDLIFPLYILFAREGQPESKIDGSVLGVVTRVYFIKKGNFRPFIDLEMNFGSLNKAVAYYAFASNLGIAYKKQRLKIALIGGAAYAFESFGGSTRSGVELRASALLGINF